MVKKLFILLCLCSIGIGSAWGAKGDLLCGGSFVGAFPTESNGSWSGSDVDFYSGNGYKFDSNETVKSPTLKSGVKSINIKVMLGYNGSANSTFIVAAYDKSGNKLVETENIVPTEAYNKQTKYYEYSLDAKDSEISYVQINFTKSSNYGMKEFYVYDATTSTGPTLSSIAISGTPTKTTYEVGEEFDPAGLVVTGTYYDETQGEITSGIEWTINPSTFTSTSETSVSVSAKVGTVSSGAYNVTGLTITEHVVTPGTYEISLNNTLYGVATGNNGTEQSVIKKDITIVSGCLSSASSKTYYDAGHIRYYTDSYLKLSAPNGYEITSVIFTADGTWNGSINVNGGTYNNSTKTWAGSESEVDFSFGAQNRIASIKVTYETPKALTSIAVKTQPTKTEYFVDDEFAPAGLVITATYEGGSTKDIEYNATDFAFTGYNSQIAGKQTITVTYKEKSATFDVTVKARTLTAITINGDLSKNTYVEGENVDISNLTAQGKYDDGSSKDLTDEVEWTVNPSTLTTSVTSVTVTATLGEISGTKDFTITVKEKTFANTYTSNVILSTEGGTSASNATVSYGGSKYEAIKAGTGSVAGKCVVIIPANTTTLHFHAAAWNKETVQLDVNGTKYDLTADTGISGSSTSYTLVNDAESDDYFTFEPNGAKEVTFTATGDCRFVLFGVNVDDEAYQNVTISDAGWATACLPMNATVSGATAYYVKVDDGKLVKTEADVIPAGTGVLLKGKGTAKFTISSEDVDNVEENMMVGCLAQKTLDKADTKYYILANDSKDGLGFYFQKEGGASATCAAGKAVLAVPTEVASAKAGFPFDDEPTGISESMVSGQSTTVYNLNGMKVDKNYNGIVIMNGKKYLNK